ncbi:hypothetical protein BDR05DRAFT_609390 [Suillus weaverae]|nr:hypothetical protein BDR05DRAFT_609390 [Suillus weaverae]
MVSELAYLHDARSSVLESQSQPPQPRDRNVAVVKPRVRPALLQRLSVGDARPVVEIRGVVLDSQSRGVAMEQPRGLGMGTQRPTALESQRSPAFESQRAPGFESQRTPAFESQVREAGVETETQEGRQCLSLSQGRRIWRRRQDSQYSSRRRDLQRSSLRSQRQPAFKSQWQPSFESLHENVQR